jgi:hypothetical protein
MSKFYKRIKKTCGVKDLKNVLVVGSAFGNLDDLLETFTTVFVLLPFDSTIKRRNLVYRQGLDNIEAMVDIDAIFIERRSIKVIKPLYPIWQRWKPTLFIEGEEIISKEDTKPLTLSSYRLIDTQKGLQVWKIQN